MHRSQGINDSKTSFEPGSHLSLELLESIEKSQLPKYHDMFKLGCWGCWGGRGHWGHWDLISQGLHWVFQVTDKFLGSLG